MKKHKNLSGMSVEDLCQKRKEARLFLAQARILKQRGDQDFKTHHIRINRRLIATINTVLSLKESKKNVG